ncbi:MAG: serine esterase [Pedosphaera sp.]|nr:serine esterase [Pedosphaera sp.]
MLQNQFVPAEEKDSRHLMVVLHGLGDSAEGFRWLPEAMRLPWLNYLLVNAPDEYHGGFSWYDIYHNPHEGIERSRPLLFSLLEEKQREGFPAEQTFLFGFSQGCLMTLEVALRFQHRLAGLIGVSGYAHEPERAVRELSPVALQQEILMTHGLADPLIPFDKVRAQVQLLQKAGLRIDWREFNKAHTIAGEEELAVIRGFVNGHAKTRSA